MTLVLALPERGRLREAALAVARAARVAATWGYDISIRERRVRYLAPHVGTGSVFDAGVVAEDLLAEAGNTGVRPVAVVGGSATEVRWLVPAESPVVDVAELDGMRVATEFPRLAEDSARAHGVRVRIVPLPGTAEASVADGLADAVVGCVCSGGTSAAHGLVTVGPRILRSRVVLVRRPSLPAEALRALDAVVTALVMSSTCVPGWSVCPATVRLLARGGVSHPAVAEVSAP